MAVCLFPLAECPSWRQLLIMLIWMNFALVITLDFYLHHVEVADQDPASGSLYSPVGCVHLVGRPADLQGRALYFNAEKCGKILRKN